MLALRETLVFLRGSLERILSDIHHTTMDSFSRYFPLGNIRIFVTKSNANDTFALVYSDG